MWQTKSVRRVGIKPPVPFGEAVAFELKERVFRPSAESARVVPPDEDWKRVLEGMLGQMIECLLQAGQPNHPTAKQLSEWPAKSCPRLREHIRKTPPASLLTASEAAWSGPARIRE
jgi:hypothetical protein